MDKECMNRILVIEPSQMLRHAFAVALSPDYLVETTASFPDAAAIADADLVIVDAVVLQKTGMLGGKELKAVRSWPTAVIWIDSEPVADPGALIKCLRLKWPLDRDGLRKAVANCLQKIFQPSAETAKVKKVTMPVPQKVPDSEHASITTDRGERRLIELVDIVE